MFYLFYAEDYGVSSFKFEQIEEKIIDARIETIKKDSKDPEFHLYHLSQSQVADGAIEKILDYLDEYSECEIWLDKDEQL